MLVQKDQQHALEVCVFLELFPRAAKVNQNTVVVGATTRGHLSISGVRPNSLRLRCNIHGTYLPNQAFSFIHILEVVLMIRVRISRCNLTSTLLESDWEAEGWDTILDAVRVRTKPSLSLVF